MRPFTVRTIKGYAGGLDRKASVTLQVTTQADTVEEVRELCELAPELVGALQVLLSLHDHPLTKVTHETAIENARSLLAKLEGGGK